MVVVLAGAGLTAGCGNNSGMVCADAKAAYERYVGQVRAVPAASPGEWRGPTDELAARVEGLAKKAEDEELRKVLRAEAERLRAAAETIATGDAAQLTAALNGSPSRLGAVCD